MASIDGRGLTERQRQIVEAVMSGASNREIAARLGISHQTVKNQLTTIYEKLGVTGRVQLITSLGVGDGGAVTGAQSAAGKPESPGEADSAQETPIE